MLARSEKVPFVFCQVRSSARHSGEAIVFEKRITTRANYPQIHLTAK